MANYATAAQAGAMIGLTPSATSRPTSTQVAVMLDNADGIINAFLRQSTNVTDTYGYLQTAECHLVAKMINNFMAFTEPESYTMMEIFLTEEDKKQIARAHSLWAWKTWEMGID